LSPKTEAKPEKASRILSRRIEAIPEKRMQRPNLYAESFLDKLKADLRLNPPPAISGLNSGTSRLEDCCVSGVQDSVTVAEVGCDAVRIISRDYFLPSCSMDKDQEFKQKVWEFCVRRSERNPTRKCILADDVKEELEKRKAMRKMVRRFAVSRLHKHYWVAFHENVDTLKLNNFDEIIAYIEGLYRDANVNGDDQAKEQVSSLVGYLMYISFKNIPRWECIQAHEFMQIHNIEYEPDSTGKGCIAKCINDVKSEQNKRLQNIADKFNENLTSRMSRKDSNAENLRKRPGSGCFYVTNTKVKRKNVDCSHDVVYKLVSDSAAPSSSIGRRAEGIEPNADDDPLQEMVENLLEIIAVKLAYMRNLPELVRSFYLRRLVSSMDSLPDEKTPLSAHNISTIAKLSASFERTRLEHRINMEFNKIEQTQTPSGLKESDQSHSDGESPRRPNRSIELEDESQQQQNEHSDDDGNSILEIFTVPKSMNEGQLKDDDACKEAVSFSIMWSFYYNYSPPLTSPQSAVEDAARKQ